ncbi:MAG: N-acetyl-gamma-glutamyl-phosphate reductase [Phycisphaeraceae bacterium]|nr:MAG: N-acetyl-gamma-glutamyl-phosphate reductase [Phycisphaeraceae bacterium]
MRTDGLPDSGSERSVAIIGASGYTGAELAWWLAHHPVARLVSVFGGERSAADGSVSMASLFPRLRGICDLPVLPLDLGMLADLHVDAVFLATPHEVSCQLAPELLERGLIVIDLSAAFRLSDAGVFEKHYSFAHSSPELLSDAVYGLPELHRDDIAGADLIACPGCYPTASILALHPIVRSGLMGEGTLGVIDAVSGVSGAGRRPHQRTQFCEVSYQPYGIGNHRHAPEIEEHAGCPVVFTPHLAEWDRGILATIHITLGEDADADDITRLYEDAYATEPFVRLLPQGEWPSVAGVRGSNFCDLAWHIDERRRHLTLFSAIDNLVKGASGQAVQCMNARFGIPESAGLIPGELLGGRL